MSTDAGSVIPGPVLSVVIPTRNRYKTLRTVVDQLLAWSSDDFEIVVEDNTDDNSGFVDVLERHSRDARLRYAHFTGSRSMVENCEAAVSRARGEVLTVIGDDDLVARQCIDAARWMVDNDIDTLVSGVAGYTWPDMEHAVSINSGSNGKLVVPGASGSIGRPDPRKLLRALSLSGAQRLGEAPRLYQALARRSVLQRIVADIGVCFPGPVPDMSSAIALGKHARACAVTDVPLIVSGQSRSSMSGQNSVRKHQGDIRSEKSLPADAAERWDPRIPRYWSAPTIWAETALKAAERTGQWNFIERFSFARVYAACLAYNDRRYFPLVSDAMRHGGMARALLLAPRVAWFLGAITWQRALNLARKVVVGFPGETFEDVALATERVERLIDEGGLMKKMIQNYSGRGQV